MKQYLGAETGADMIQQLSTIDYPTCAYNLENYPLVADFYSQERQKVITTAPPSKLIGEAVVHFGREPKNIIDIGCGTGLAALYLATQGHYVTAIDERADMVEMARERARELNIPSRNFTPEVADLRSLSTADKYQGVISEMVLHFLEEADAKAAVATIQGMTVKDGLNVISAYTDDNPEDERSRREVKYMFEAGELSRLYMRGWQRLRDGEGYSGKLLERSYGPGKDVLIATIAEIVARKTVAGTPLQLRRSYMNANREMVYPDQ